MKILITGGSGFIGGSLVEALSGFYDVYYPNHDELDLLSLSDVENYFSRNKFDLVIHCAIQGGKSHITDEPKVLYNNLIMFSNIIKNRDSFSHLINFTSGYELDPGKDLQNSYPRDYYGLSKNIISKWILEHEGITNIRIFGIFGEREYDGRFVKKSIINSLNGVDIEIFEDKLWDFIYIEDLILCVKEIVKDPKKFRNEFDLVHPEKRTFLDIANLIKKETLSQSNIIVLSKSKNNYCGDASYILSQKIGFVGIENGIKSMVKNMIE